MIVHLMKKLRSILSNNRHCLKQAFQERPLPKVNQQPVSKTYLVSQQQPQNLFPFFLSPSQTTLAIFQTKIIQETFTIKFAYTKMAILLALLLCSSYVQACSFSVRTIIGTHHNLSRTWPNRLKNPLKPIVNLAKTVSDTKNDQK